MPQNNKKWRLQTFLQSTVGKLASTETVPLGLRVVKDYDRDRHLIHRYLENLISHYAE